jgi:hypothetical protein
VNDVVLDASALLAVLRAERGAERVEQHLDGASIGVANLSEVVAKLIEVGKTEGPPGYAIGYDHSLVNSAPGAQEPAKFGPPPYRSLTTGPSIHRSDKLGQSKRRSTRSPDQK